MIEEVWPLPSMVDAVMPTIEQALANHKRLADTMLALTTVPSGKYALFTHNANQI